MSPTLEALTDQVAVQLEECKKQARNIRNAEKRAAAAGAAAGDC